MSVMKANPVPQPEPEIDAIMDKTLETFGIKKRQKIVQDGSRKLVNRHGASSTHTLPTDAALRDT